MFQGACIQGLRVRQQTLACRGDLLCGGDVLESARFVDSRRPFGRLKKSRWALCPFFICGAGMDLVQLVEQTLSGMGYELVDIEMSPKGRVLRIFMDIERGIVVEDCAAVSNQLTRLFEVEQFEYDRLEVSSPGLDRPLKKAADFERFAGQQAQVRTRLPIGNQRNFAGVLLGMRDGAVILQTEKSEVALPLDQVEKARLVPKF